MIAINMGFKCRHTGCERVFDSKIGRAVHLERYHGVPSESLDWIENRTFENLVHLYTDELYKIQSDRVIGGVLDQRETTRLLREGVLIIEEYGRMGKQTIYKLSEDTLDILNRVFTSVQ